MGSVFDSLVDMTLGLVAPVAPVVQPTFAPDRTPVLPLELDVIEQAPVRRTVQAASPVSSAEPGRTFAVAHREVARDPATPPADPVPAIAVRPHLRSVLQPLVPLLASEPPAAAIAVQPRTTPISAVLPAHAPGHASLSVTIGGTTMQIAAGEPAISESRPAPTRPRSQARASRDASPPHAADDPQSQTRAAGEPVVRVTIGRVDVRAIQAREPAARPAPAARTSSLALADYLRDRAKRGSRE